MESMAGPKLGDHAIKQPMFNWEAEYEYNELKTFKLQVNNILCTYNFPQNDQVIAVQKAIQK